MARLVWVGVGAFGGVYVYRKGERAAEAVREQGLIGTMQVLAAAVLHSNAALRDYGPAQHEAGLRVGRFRVSRVQTTRADPNAIMNTRAPAIAGRRKAR